MIKYPILENNATIGITAPSSGVGPHLHPMLDRACSRMNELGFKVVCGKTVRTQDKAKSSPAKTRAAELNLMLQDDKINMIIPPWGGELLIEVLEHIDFENLESKWVLGYSDISLMLLAITLKTGIATAHGPCLMDLRGEVTDITTEMWQQVLSTKAGDSVVQHSSSQYQKDWNEDNSGPSIFHLTEQTSWKMVSQSNAKLQGRLLGGCIDCIRHLIGTPYGDVRHFQQHELIDEPIIWYLENCELNTADLRRSLIHMKLAGWFNHCSGLIFGRSSGNKPIDNYTAEDVYQELAEELQLPVIYDADFGHVPPQMTFINGAFAEVEVSRGKGTLKQSFI